MTLPKAIFFITTNKAQYFLVSVFFPSAPAPLLEHGEVQRPELFVAEHHSVHLLLLLLLLLLFGTAAKGDANRPNVDQLLLVQSLGVEGNWFAVNI